MCSVKHNESQNSTGSSEHLAVLIEAWDLELGRRRWFHHQGKETDVLALRERNGKRAASNPGVLPVEMCNPEDRRFQGRRGGCLQVLTLERGGAGKGGPEERLQLRLRRGFPHGSYCTQVE